MSPSLLPLAGWPPPAVWPLLDPAAGAPPGVGVPPGLGVLPAVGAERLSLPGLLELLGLPLLLPEAEGGGVLAPGADGDGGWD